jgi:hypothetical protein
MGRGSRAATASSHRWISWQRPLQLFLPDTCRRATHSPSPSLSACILHRSLRTFGSTPPPGEPDITRLFRPFTNGRIPRSQALLSGIICHSSIYPSNVGHTCNVYPIASSTFELSGTLPACSPSHAWKASSIGLHRSLVSR